MKVIRKGTPSAEEIFEGEFRDCHSVMQEKRGALKVEYDQRDNDTFAHATCPVCGKDFVMTPKKEKTR